MQYFRNIGYQYNQNWLTARVINGVMIASAIKSKNTPLVNTYVSLYTEREFLCGFLEIDLF